MTVQDLQEKLAKKMGPTSRLCPGAVCPSCKRAHYAIEWEHDEGGKNYKELIAAHMASEERELAVLMACLDVVEGEA